MSSLRYRGFRGPLRAVILDWAGTAVDHGSIAPTQALTETFAAFGISISPSQARGPMGVGKREHIVVLGALPDVAAQWNEQHGCSFTDDDADRLYEAYSRIQPRLAAERARPIAGLTTALSALREQGIRIGSTTGYPKSVVQAMVTAAAQGGYRPEAVVCDDDVVAGRPAPFMVLEAMRRLEVWPVASCLVVDDTQPGIQAGRNAGMWTAGVTVTGSYVGLDEGELAELKFDRRRALRNSARRRLQVAGAHHIVDSVAELPSVVEAVGKKLARGQRP